MEIGYCQEMDPSIKRTEAAEVAAWEDLYAAAPPDFRARYELNASRVGGALVLTSAGLHLAHFNSVLGLGTEGPAGADVVDAVLECFRRARSPKFYIHTIAGVQTELEQDLIRRQLRLASGWDRVLRGDAPFVSAGTEGVEFVTSATQSEWAGFIDRMYHLPTGPWLESLVGRPGWHHAILREGGAVAAARSLYLNPATRDGWMGIDAPVPGIMTPRYDMDRKLCTALVGKALALGARSVAADVEKPSPDRRGPGYENFHSLGFVVPYLRHNFMPAA